MTERALKETAPETNDLPDGPFVAYRGPIPNISLQRRLKSWCYASILMATCSFAWYGWEVLEGMSELNFGEISFFRLAWFTFRCILVVTLDLYAVFELVERIPLQWRWAGSLSLATAVVVLLTAEYLADVLYALFAVMYAIGALNLRHHLSPSWFTTMRTE